MGSWCWVLVAILAAAVIVLALKVHSLQKGADEIAAAFAQRLEKDTNTLIDLSTRDKHLRKLAADINVQLRKLRVQSLRYYEGDQELKNAVTNISHDLRTPLTAIFGYLDLLEQENLTPEVRRYAEIIRDRAQLLTQLTEELFRYSIVISVEDTELETVNLGDVLEESIAAFYTELREKQIEPVIHLPETKVTRNLNRGALGRIFSNLLNNAVKYSAGDLEIALTETGEITFANSVTGLDEMQVGRLFDRFYTVEAARKSTGLGLAIAKTLVEQMGGSISAVLENERLQIRVVFPEKS
ncbi:MAG: HAMP domain-containing histidine kinase [Acutalibacter sp.]|nr:HAMP domain-containing histidine kinase [Acutalibacter sp.]